MGFLESNGLRYYQFDIFKGHPLFHAVITRQGGFSKGPYASLNTGGTVGDDPADVLANHHKIYETFGYPFDSRFDVWQVHGNEVLCTDAPREASVPHAKADGILTTNPAVTLFMRFADCVPILLYDPVKQVIGIAHAGWQGTFKKVAKEAVDKMTACYGSLPKDILAGIGPSICQQCYEVGKHPGRHLKRRLARHKPGVTSRNRMVGYSSTYGHLIRMSCSQQVWKISKLPGYARRRTWMIGFLTGRSMVKQADLRF